MIKNICLLFVSHFLIFFNGFFGSLLIVSWMIMSTDKVIDWCLWLNLWQLLQLSERNLWDQGLIFNIKWTWPLMGIVNVEILQLWISGFEVLKVINHNLNQFHFEDFTSLRLESWRNWARIWFWAWLCIELNYLCCVPWHSNHQLRLIELHLPSVIVELWSNVQYLLQMRLSELPFQWFFHKLFGISKCGVLLFVDVEPNTLIDCLLELKQKSKFFT